MNFRIILSPRAQRDLRQIEKYVAKDDPDAARKLCGKLLTAAESLDTFPLRGGCDNAKPARTLICRPYIIFYDVDLPTRQVQILRFWHSARNQGRLRLKEEQARVYSAVAERDPATASVAKVEA